MPTITLHQTELGNDRYHVTLSSDAPGLTLQHEAEVDFHLDPRDQELIRWYLEEYLANPFDPNPEIAARTEQRMAHLGEKLFKAIFKDTKAILWWGRVIDNLADYRIEVATSVAGATAIPWELLRDPDSDIILALRAAELVRSHRQANIQPRIPEPAEQLRILLVICRPHEGQDVPFRSVASHLVRGLNEEARDQIGLTVLRPPTFARLSQVLADAKARGEPFHLVHFDGHGTYADAERLKATLSEPDALRFRTQRTGSQGFLLFENPDAEDNTDYVNGPDLAELLVRNQVPVIILNACRSAHADSGPEAPRGTGEAAAGQLSAGQFAASGHARAFSSLAQEVMDAGVAGVVAMRYNLWVVTATRFVFELYRNLARGLGLGAAVSQGRRQLHSEPQRRIAYRSLPLQDWSVPVVFEAAPIRLLPPRPGKQTDWTLNLGQGSTRKDNLPPPPDIGFIGRDETLLALDRAFDDHKVVLLHAYAGSGKTVTAVEFARWYLQTDGLQGGPLLFTSFESLKPLYQVLGDFGEVFGPTLEQHGIQWGAINELEQRRDIALEVMAQVPMLWIWDNVEPITGFPEGTESAWSATEQQELHAFLQAANQTRAKILLTSRRDERPLAGRPPQAHPRAPDAHDRARRLRRGPGAKAGPAPRPGRLAPPAALLRGQSAHPAGGGAPSPGRGAARRLGDRRLRRAAAQRRGGLRRRGGPGARLLPRRLPRLRLRPGLWRAGAGHPRPAGLLSGLRGCGCVEVHGCPRGGLDTARPARPGARPAYPPAGPRRPPRPARQLGRWWGRRLLPHPPRPALVLPPPLPAPLPRDRRGRTTRRPRLGSSSHPRLLRRHGRVGGLLHQTIRRVQSQRHRPPARRGG
jgi:hypothetical protein